MRFPTFRMFICSCLIIASFFLVLTSPVFADSIIVIVIPDTTYHVDLISYLESWVGFCFANTGSFTLTTAGVNLLKSGAPQATGTATIEVYSTTGTVPGHCTDVGVTITLIATSTTSLDSTTLSTSDAPYTFNFNGESVNIGTLMIVFT